MFNGLPQETRDDGKNINIVTRGGTKIEKMHQFRIKTNTNGLERIQHLNNILMRARKKKHSSRLRKEILQENIASTSNA
jgi:hypothetical protein